MRPANILARFQRISWIQPSVIALVLANLVPLAGVFLFQWEVFPLLFLFWLENVVIGVLNAVKMLLAGGGFVDRAVMTRLMQQPSASPDSVSQTTRNNLILGLLFNSFFLWTAKLFMVLFFCAHYGIFAFVHGTILVALFAGDKHYTLNFLNVPMILQIIRDNHLGLPFAGLLASHLVSFFHDFLWRGEFRRTNVMVQMAQPYSRVVLMHVTILAGGLLMMALHLPAAGLAILVVLKMAFDLAGHQGEREKFARTGNSGADSPINQTPAGPIPAVLPPEMRRVQMLSRIAPLAAILFFIIMAMMVCGFVAPIFGAFGNRNDRKPAAAVAQAAQAAQPPLTNRMADLPWTLDLSRIEIPRQAVSGKFRGDDFAADRATFRNGTLSFHDGTGVNEREIAIAFHLPDNESIEGKTFQVSPQDAFTTNSIQVKMTWKSGGKGSITQPYDTGYAMKLELGARIRNTIPARIYLCLPDAQQSRIAGTFRAIVRKDRP